MTKGMLYIISLSLDLAFVTGFAFSKKGDNKTSTRVLRELAIVVSITMLSSMLAIILPNKQVSLFFQTLHFASTEWMLVFLMRFLEVYTEKVNATMKSRMVFMILCTINTISLLLNAVFHHVVDSERVQVGNEQLYAFTTKAWGYIPHLIFCYALVLMIFITLSYTLIKTVPLYRKKYAYALVIIGITVGADGFCTAMKYTHDFSLYGYALVGIFFTYFTLYYKPKGIINRTLAYVATNSHNGVVCFDPEDNCIYANEVARLMNRKDATYEDYKAGMLKFIKASSFRDIEEQTWHEQIKVGNSRLRVEVNFAKLFDERDNYIGCYFTIVDRTEELENFDRERYRATHDSLTGLYNREYFYQKVAKIVKYNPEKNYYIICIDIKDFKLVNDLFGYEKGNEILVQCANQLKETLPENVMAARLVSDHFAICIPKELYQEEYLLACLSKAQNLISDSEFQLRFIAGIYQTNPGDKDVSVMCDHANMAIASIKNEYDRMIAFYDQELMAKVKKSKNLINEFDHAIRDKEFVMYLQPQVRMDGSIIGAEALVRWIHPKKGMISPGDFIPVFEDAGLIHRLDLCIWEQAAAKLKEWKDKGNNTLHISVNISAKDFYYIDIYKAFTELVEKYEISPSNLKLEITETALMQDLDKQLELINRLQQYGFDVEIDDFGSGYSSLNMLKNIKADVLKIDMGFLQEIQDQERTKIILGMVVDLAKRLEMLVITEGVEEKTQVDYLTSVGCDMFQGYYFAKPIPVADFEETYL